jgi:hypothetical protein
MAIVKADEEWGKRAARHLKAELKRAGVTYHGLANLLKKEGVRDETKASVSSKLAEGRITPAFILASLNAIGCEAVNLEDI